MAKTFKSGLDSLLDSRTEREEVSMKRENPAHKKAVQKNEAFPEQEIRATLQIKKTLHDDVKALAHFERKMIKDVFDEALTLYIKNHKKTVLGEARALFDSRKEMAD